MRELTLIRQDGGCYIDSREVAELIGKRHDNLLRDIMGYAAVMRKSDALNFEDVDFFVDSSYLDAKGEKRPCYLLSKMGCELVANKLTGEKGILFTAAYVAKFNERETAKREELESLIEAAKQPIPRLGEINACVRIIVRGMKHFGSTPEWIMQFLKETYEPLGFSVPVVFDDAEGEATPRWYTAQQIAEECGLYSLQGKPHSQAVACILSVHLKISDKHKRVDAESYGCFTGVSVRYDDDALYAVILWLLENGLPDVIYGVGRCYRVAYKSD
jgi:Rha family phage regulatory protein